MTCTFEFGLLICLTMIDLYSVKLGDANMEASVAVVKDAGRQRIRWSSIPAFIRTVIVSVTPPPARPNPPHNEKYTHLAGRVYYQSASALVHTFVRVLRTLGGL